MLNPKKLPGSLKILRGFAYSVAVITTLGDGAESYAVPATAVTPVNKEPPAMLNCVDRSVANYEKLKGGAYFCLTILESVQMDIANRCAKSRGEDRY